MHLFEAILSLTFLMTVIPSGCRLTQNDFFCYRTKMSRVLLCVEFVRGSTTRGDPALLGKMCVMFSQTLRFSSQEQPTALRWFHPHRHASPTTIYIQQQEAVRYTLSCLRLD